MHMTLLIVKTLIFLGAALGVLGEIAWGGDNSSLAAIAFMALLGGFGGSFFAAFFGGMYWDLIGRDCDKKRAEWERTHAANT